jgi:UDP-glucuronate decarboxylase
VNLGNPDEFTIKELALLTIELTGSKSKLINMPLPADDPRQRQPDISLAHDVLGWKPKVRLANGLRRTIDYFDKLLKGQVEVKTPGNDAGKVGRQAAA